MRSQLGAFAVIAILIITGCFITGCSPSEPARKDTYPLTGQVVVDGAPAANVQVQVHNVAGMDEKMPTNSSAITDAEGKFQMSTYEKGDGVPAGDYVLTFLWQQFDVLNNNYGGPDKLKGRYSNPKTTSIKVKVEEGKPTDMGKIELKTR